MRPINRILTTLLCLAPLTPTAFALQPTSAYDAQSLRVSWLDVNIQPGTNFFKFANGTWQKNNPVPAAYGRWDTFQVLQESNQDFIHRLLEATAKNPNNAPNSTEQKVGDFYFSGMDEATINKTDSKPLQAEFERINQIETIHDLKNAIAHLQMLGVDAVFKFTQMIDFTNSDQVIGVAEQDGLGLPDRDYYLKDDAKFKQIRKLYVAHIARMFQLLGDEAKVAEAEAKVVMEIETTLAKASMSRIAQRDPHAVYHMMNREELKKLTPNFAWDEYFAQIGHPDFARINVAMPTFFKTMDTQLTTVSLDHWKTYLRWHLINTFAPYLSDRFVNEQFSMVSVLTGAKELLPRWKRVILAEDEALGFAIGKLYVQKTFPPSSKQAAQEMLVNIRTALANDLAHLSWMTPETRKAALNKLDQLEMRVGYPDKWRDYQALTVSRGPYINNILNANQYLIQYELNKIGKPVDRSEWDMTPQTVNAYYEPSMNNLTIPAGILQPPFFDPNAPMAINYGAIGFVMGHEMTHAFDDQGAQFDGKGNLHNWWKPLDLKKFQAATQCIATQFSGYTVSDQLHVQGKLVVGEATADLGGLILAYHAFLDSAAYKTAKTIDHYTPQQQFFLGAAHVWATNILPQESRRRIITDPHPPAVYRVNGTLANMQQFQEAYHVPIEGPMVNKKRCVIW